MLNLKVLTQAAKIFFTKKKVPFYAYLSLTQACNLTCSYCFTNSPEMVKNKKLDPLLNTKKIKDVIDELWDLGSRMLSLAGGEPMLRGDIGEIISYSKKKGFFTQLYTNGTRSFEKNIDYIKKLDHLLISIEGPKDIHDLDRRDVHGAGSFDKIFENIKYLRKNKIVFTIVYSASLNNMMHIRRFLDECNENYGFIPNTVIAEVLANETSIEKNKLYPTHNQLKLFWQEVKNLKEEGYPIFMSIEQMNDLILASDGDTKLHLTDLYYSKDKIPKELQSYAPCSWGKYGIFFDPSGYMYPCPKLYDNKKYGENAFEVGFKNAYKKVSNLDCIMCRGTVNSAMTKLLNMNLKSGLYTTYQATKYYFRKKLNKNKVSGKNI